MKVIALIAAIVLPAAAIAEPIPLSLRNQFIGSFEKSRVGRCHTSNPELIECTDSRTGYMFLLEDVPDDTPSAHCKAHASTAGQKVVKATQVAKGVVG